MKTQLHTCCLMPLFQTRFTRNRFANRSAGKGTGSRFLVWLSILFVSSIPGLTRANDPPPAHPEPNQKPATTGQTMGDSPAGKAATESGNDESIIIRRKHSPGPPKENQTSGTDSLTRLRSLLSRSEIKLTLIIGAGLIAILLVLRMKQAPAIPSEALEILGSLPVDNRQSMRVIRFGRKLVLVEQSSSGFKPISEITDPEEVSHLLELLQNPGKRK